MGAAFSAKGIESIGSLAFFFVGLMIFTGAVGIFYPICSVIAVVTKKKSFGQNLFLIILALIVIGYGFFALQNNKNTKLILSVTHPITSSTKPNSVVISPSDKPLTHAEKEFDFKKIRWGMSKEEVKKSEGKELIVESQGLSLKTKINGLNSYLSYIFSDNKLYSVGYTITELDKVQRKNDLYRDAPKNWGTAISLGHLFYLTAWETGRTEIYLSLIGDNFKINFAVGYLSKESKNNIEKRNQEEILEQL